MAEVLNPFWVGIDVSKEKFDAAIWREGSSPEQWRQLETKPFTSDKKGAEAFVRWLEKAGGECLGLCAESTGVYSSDLAGLIAAEAPALPRLAIVNPARVRATAKTLGVKDKSDSVDARVIAVYAGWHRPQPKPPRSKEWQELRVLSAARETFLADALAYEERAEASRSDACRKSFLAMAKKLRKEAEAFEKKIRALIRSDETLSRHAELLQSIPGIGPVIAHTLLAFFGDLSGWTRSEAVAGAGVYPRVHESGSSVRGKPRLSKGGGRHLRSKLYMGATHLLATDYGFNRSVLRLREKGRPPMVCLGAAMRKLVLVARAVIVSGKAWDPGHADTLAVA